MSDASGSRPFTQRSPGDKGVLLHCHANCSVDAILDALELGKADLFDDDACREPGQSSPGETSREIEARYHYQDTHENDLVCIVRYRNGEPKYEAWVPEGEGWRRARKGEGNPGVLYRLPEIQEAIALDKVIYIVEGEKDADSVRSAGGNATTQAFGASAKWPATFSKYFTGASVNVIADRDQPGLKRARAVLQALKPVAQQVEILLPRPNHEGADATDHIQAGYSLDDFILCSPEELSKMLKDVPEPHEPKSSKARTPVIVRASEIQEEKVEYLWPPYVARGKIMMLEGDPEVGKTWLLLWMMARATRGLSLDPWEDKIVCEPADVLFMTAEDGLADTILPRLHLLGADTSKVRILTGWRKGDGEEELLMNLQDCELLEAALQETRPAIVGIDPLMAFVGEKTDTYRDNAIRSIMGRLAKLSEKYRVTMVLVRHLTKERGRKAILAGLGSIGFTAAVRSAILVGFDPTDETRERRIMAHAKSNLSKKGPSQVFTIDDHGLHWLERSDLTADELLAPEILSRPRLREAVTFLKERLAHGPLPGSTLFEEAGKIGISEATLRRAREELSITVSREGEKGRRGGGHWVWSLPIE